MLGHCSKRGKDIKCSEDGNQLTYIMKSVNYSSINISAFCKARLFILINLLLFFSLHAYGQRGGCVNGPTVTLAFTSGSTCGLAPVKISGSFGGSATNIKITENGGGSVSPASISSSPFEFTYTPKSKDNGNNVTITVTTIDPPGAACSAAKATFVLTVGSSLSAPVIGTVTGPTCIIPTGNVILNGLPSSGTWALTRYPDSVTSSGTGISTTVSGLSPGTYSFSVTNHAGCISNMSDNAVIPVQSVGVVANAGTGGHVCGLDFAFSAVITNGTGTWTKINGPGNAVFSPDNHHPDSHVNVDQVGTYDFAWNIDNSACSSMDIARVIFHELPVIEISSKKDTTICKGVNIQLHASGVGFFSWSPAALFNNPNISDPVATPVTSAILTVTLTDQFGCMNSDDITVNVKTKPVANAGPDQVLESQISTIMNAVLYNNDETGVWSLISGKGEFYDSSNAKATVNDLSPDMNKFLWTVNNGVCPPSSDTVMITIGDVLIPTLITPNMDGRNDYMVIGGLGEKGNIAELIIFDRRGVQVYKNTNYDNLWNGVDYNDNPLPEDTYFYILKTNGNQSVKGFIVIRR
jgi:gliding motility-associated-like protein